MILATPPDTGAPSLNPLNRPRCYVDRPTDADAALRNDADPFAKMHRDF